MKSRVRTIIIFSIVLISISTVIIFTQFRIRKNANIDYGLFIKTYDAKFKSDMYVGLILRSKIIKSFPCKAGPVIVFENGMPHFVRLSQDHVFMGDLIPKGSKLYLRQSGIPSYYYLSKSTKIQDYYISAYQRMAENMSASIEMVVLPISSWCLIQLFKIFHVVAGQTLMK